MFSWWIFRLSNICATSAQHLLRGWWQKAWRLVDATLLFRGRAKPYCLEDAPLALQDGACLSMNYER